MGIKLLDHQKEVLDKTKSFDRVAYYLDMGLGKTFVGSEKLFSFGNSVNLVVCQKSKVADWLEHFKMFYPEITVADATKNNFMPSKEDVLIINYDVLFRRKWISELRGFTLLLDESSMIKNEQSKRAKAILKLSPKNVILLSGTPTGGKYEELWSQLHLLGWNIKKDLYLDQYTTYEWRDFGGFFTKYITGYKNVERLKRKLADHGAVFMKTDEVISLPAQTEISIEVNATKDYRKFMKDGIVGDLVGDTTLTKLLYARMLCGSFNKEKLQAFKDLVDSTEDRLIVFYNFNNELKELKKLVDKPISEINGLTKDLKAYESKSNSVTFVQYQSGAMGLNLQKANKIIYFTLPLSSELFEQSKKRTHRIGQDKPCFYYYLICKNSVEEKIKAVLEKRGDYTDQLFRMYRP